MKQILRQIVFLGSTVILAIVLFGGSFVFWKGKFAELPTSNQAPPPPPPAPIQPPPPPPPPLPEPKEQITLMFVGDIMLNRGVALKIKQNKNNWKLPFLKITDTLRKADFLFGNLEHPISDKGVKGNGTYNFRADPRAIEGLLFAGFKVFSVANNHIFDYGKEAFEDTLKRLWEVEIEYAGGGFNVKEAHSPAIQEIKGVNIGILAYTNVAIPQSIATEKKSGIAWIDEHTINQLKQDIQQAKAKTDILVVSLHGGEEYAKEPSPFQELFAKIAIQEGADVVIGNHTHVVQALEQYQTGWIAYSLGNFVFDQNFSEETMRGAILKVIVQNKKIKDVILLKTKLNPSFQVELNEEPSAQ